GAKLGAELEWRREGLDVGHGLQIEAQDVEHAEAGFGEGALQLADQARVAGDRMEREQRRAIETQPYRVVAGGSRGLDVLERRRVRQGRRRQREQGLGHPAGSYTPES